MSAGVVSEVVLVGRDAPVWLAACVLQQALAPAGVKITVVELPSRLHAADAYATLPALEPLHTRLKIDESKLIGVTRGAFTLGKRFVDTSGSAPAFFHAYGSHGARIDRKEFLPCWLRARKLGLEVALEDFCLTAAAAKQGRMLVPDSGDRGARLHRLRVSPACDRVQRSAQVHRAEARGRCCIRRGRPQPCCMRMARSCRRSNWTAAGASMVTSSSMSPEKRRQLLSSLAVQRETWRDRFRCGSRARRLRRSDPSGSGLFRSPRLGRWVGGALSDPDVHTYV